MYNNLIEYMSWDSDFFNKKIGRLLITDVNNLESFLKDAATTGYQLIYVFGDKEYFVNNDIIKKFNGKLIDRKIVYEKRITSAEGQLLSVAEGINISEYIDNELTLELEQLAYISGRYSRFKLDNNFGKNDFFKLYKIWLERSLSKEIADKVYVVKHNSIIGFVTLKYNDDIGDIGLLAIDNNNQGKGYGKQLIQRCLLDLIQKEIYTINVSTQLDNKDACVFYEKCGFNTKLITNIYHFWL
jgi:dTDP-4-amino-4,6-dideoxy-D-galactose acyltransferase